MRPRSIIRYELCYLGALLLGIAATALSWSANLNTREMKQIQGVFGASFLPIFYVFLYSLSLALWYFTARSPNVTAKWIVTGWFALSAVGMVFVVGKGIALANLPGLLSLGAVGLNAAAVWFLFRSDAWTWFGAKA